MIAEQLKKSILQAAIQGKLTKQLPEDGDAHDLLREIQKEKSRLIKEGKIKKEKPLPGIKEDEIPFDIPKNWCWVRLRSVILQNVGGGTPSKSNLSYWHGNIAWASVKDLNCKFLNSTQDYISKEGLNNSSTNLIPKGNLIVCTRMGLGKIVYNTIDVAINQDLRALFFSEKINKWYIYYFYLTLNMSGKGATVKGISVEELSNALLPLPPFAEQLRIVEHLEKLLPEIDKLKIDEFRLDVLQRGFPKRLRASVLQCAVEGKLTEQLPSDGDAHDLLAEIQKEKARLIREGKIKKEKPSPEITEDEKPFDIPDNWCWVRLGTILQKLTDGTHVTPKYTQTGVPFLSVKDVSNGQISFDNTKFISLQEHRELYKRCNPQIGDILLTKVGTTGIPVLIETEIEFSLFVSVALLKFSQDLLCGKFLVYLLQSPLVGVQCEENTKGVGNKNWVIRDISNTLIALPPLAEQNRIVQRLNELLPEIDKLERLIQVQNN